MEQKTTKVSKRQLWSVYVFIEREVQEGRSMLRRRRLTQARKDIKYVEGKQTQTVQFKYLYLNVTKMYKKDGILYVQEGVGKKKVQHMHDIKSVVSIQVREHDRSGRVT